jgi:hypothetical protein
VFRVFNIVFAGTRNHTNPNSKVRIVDVSAGSLTKQRVAANWGIQNLPKQEAAGYGVHPALGDACIHLAAVPPAGAAIQHVR